MKYEDLDRRHMLRAIELAKRGEGHVEPNPMVGCVIARNEEVLAEGWHRAWGGNHAEIAAIEALPESTDPSGTTLYVTLEPCCHHGKTPPCTDAIVQSGIRRIVIGRGDPFPEVNGRGIAHLRKEGLDVSLGLLETEVSHLMDPYLTRIRHGRPWIIAKWAMTLDGKIATHTGDSQWISGESSRAIVHRLRGRVDAILVGGGTVKADDPLLTARPAGARVATRIVWTSQGRIPPDSQLIQTAEQVPVIVAGAQIASEQREFLEKHHCEHLDCTGKDFGEQLRGLFSQLADRNMTNVLVEGGGRLFGALLDVGLVDEIHSFVAPKIVGGLSATTPIAGAGIGLMNDALQLEQPIVDLVDGDVYIHGRVRRP